MSAVRNDPRKERRLRVLHVTPAFAPAYRYGGPISSLEGLVDELARIGVDVRVLTTDADGPSRLSVPRGWSSRGGVPVRYLRRWAPPDLAPTLLLQAPLLAREAEVVHVTALFSMPSAVALAAGLAVERPIVFSPRGALQQAALRTGSTRLKQLWLAAMTPFLRRVLLHATSEMEADAIREALGSKASIVVIPNGTLLEPRSRALDRRPSDRTRRIPVIGTLGRIHPIKGLDRLIGALALLRDKGVTVELHLAGPIEAAGYAERLRARAAALGVGPVVRFLGELRGEAKLDFLANCDVVCLPSHSENFGNVVVEALGAFTPVVAAKGTPWRELEDSGAGRWVDNDPPSLAGALEPFLRDLHHAEEAGARGRQLVELRYSWPGVAQRTAEVYREVAGRCV